MSTLVEKALDIRRGRQRLRRKVSAEEFTLVMAWVKGDVGAAQAATVLGMGASSFYQYALTVLRYGWQEGWLKEAE